MFKLNLYYYSLFFVFILLPAFDMLNGYLVVNGYSQEGGLYSFSQLGRILASIFLIFSAHRLNLSIFWLCVFIVFLFFELIQGVFSSHLDAVIYGIVGGYRITFAVLLYLVLSELHKRSPNVIYRLFSIHIIMVASSILLSVFFEVDNSTYGWGYGSKGFFSSGNSLGLYLGCSGLLLVGLSHYVGRSFLFTSAFCINSAALLLVGSKTAFSLFVVNIFIVALLSRYVLLILPTLIVFIFSFYSYISSKISILLDVVLTRYENSSSVVSFLSSSRIEYVYDAALVFLSQSPNILRYMFGAGYFISFRDPASAIFFDTLETDFFDLFFMYGFLGVGAYLMFIIFGVKKTYRRPLYLFVLLLVCFHSMFIGHVWQNAMSLTLVVFILVFATHKKEMCRV